MASSIPANNKSIAQIPIEKIESNNVIKLGDVGKKSLFSFIIGIIQQSETKPAELASQVAPKEYTLEKGEVKVTLTVTKTKLFGGTEQKKQATTIATLQRSNEQSPEGVNGRMYNVLFAKELGISPNPRSICFYLPKEEEQQPATASSTTNQESSSSTTTVVPDSDDGEKKEEGDSTTADNELKNQGPPAFPTTTPQPQQTTQPEITGPHAPATTSTATNTVVKEEVVIDDNKNVAEMKQKQPETAKEEPTSSNEELPKMEKSFFWNLVDRFLSILKLPFKPFIALYNWLTTKVEE